MSVSLYARPQFWADLNQTWHVASLYPYTSRMVTVRIARATRAWRLALCAPSIYAAANWWPAPMGHSKIVGGRRNEPHAGYSCVQILLRAKLCNNLGQAVHLCSSVTNQYNVVSAKGRWCSAAGKVTAGLAESNVSVPSGGWLIVTWGLTACTPGSAPWPMLGNEYGKPLPFLHRP